MEVKFDNLYDFALFEAAMTQRLQIIDQREYDIDAPGPTPQEKDERIILTDVIDKSQRRRHSHDGEVDESITFRFDLVAELLVAGSSVLTAGRIVDKYPDKSIHPSRDPDVLKDELAEIAEMLDEKYPNGSMYDGMKVVFDDEVDGDE